MIIDFTDEEYQYMYEKLAEYGHKKVNALRLNFPSVNDLIPHLKGQIPDEFFKEANIEDITMVLLNKGFNVGQINQIIKAKEKGYDINKYLDTKVSANELRHIRYNDNIDER